MMTISTLPQLQPSAHPRLNQLCADMDSLGTDGFGTVGHE